MLACTASHAAVFATPSARLCCSSSKRSAMTVCSLSDASRESGEPAAGPTAEGEGQVDRRELLERLRCIKGRKLNSSPRLGPTCPEPKWLRMSQAVRWEVKLILGGAPEGGPWWASWFPPPHPPASFFLSNEAKNRSPCPCSSCGPSANNPTRLSRR